jgi:RHS repeat-associated protein
MRCAALVSRALLVLVWTSAAAAVFAANAPGAMVLEFSMATDPTTFAEGILLEKRAAGSSWEAVPAEDYLVGRRSGAGDDDLDVLVMARRGWERGTIYRVRLTPALKDFSGRPFGGSKTIELPIPAATDENPAPPVAYDKSFPMDYSSAQAASDSLGGRFPGGQVTLFQGLLHDPVTGLAYARARWYDARTASWLSEDPLGMVDSTSLYAFVGHQPHLSTDPYGLKIVLNGTQPQADFEAFLRSLNNPAAASELVAKGEGGELVVGFRQSRAQFEAKAIADPRTYRTDLARQQIPMPTDSRTIEAKIAALVADPSVVEVRSGKNVEMKTEWPFSWFDATKTYEVGLGVYGGAATVEPSESVTGNAVVVFDPELLAAGSTELAERAYGLLFDQDVTIIHELGHGLACVEEQLRFFNVWSVEFENQLRARRGERWFRTSERPLNPDPKTLRPTPE